MRLWLTLNSNLILKNGLEIFIAKICKHIITTKKFQVGMAYSIPRDVPNLQIEVR